MRLSTTVTSSLGLLAGHALAQAQQGAWAQCGGNSFSGGTACVMGYACVKLSDYYSQCQPGVATGSVSASSGITSASTALNTTAPTTLATTTTLSTPSTPTTPTTPTASAPASTNPGPGATLQEDYLWIRAVEEPHFHAYLQSAPLYGAGPAVMANYTTAGQFNVVDGQLVQLVGEGAGGEVLYGVVAEEKSKNDQALAVTFSAEKNTYGTFGWQGDGLTWSAEGVSRPNAIAWYVCEEQHLYINLGNYLYNTPDGCADETIHYYNDAHASS
ncbi:carbohydrate-binding module family 1 protein [Aplosporella prunicola CBS 121167]|uniref:Carbohydrate-binding module family 1 protein n=1 Tax=Aplosporella prunicola CBS 121167 TaxID=1176127 RepID=A0A6A6B3E2_9PEZI|nr:carbohydrate-binding module family 1 protein [Aplosporella prunicola CBS 121167]KAF2138752.1 carbohydrate-binding module family 1 protein [Aplosporella prunicola CBS 121167]